MKNKTYLLLSIGVILGALGAYLYFQPMFYSGNANIKILESSHVNSVENLLRSEKLDTKNVLISFWSLDSQKCLFKSKIDDKYLSGDCELLHVIEVDGLIEKKEAFELIKSKNLRGNYLLLSAGTYVQLLFELMRSTPEVGEDNVYPVQYFLPANQPLACLN